MKLSNEAQELVRAAVRRHLARSPAFGQLAEPRRVALAADMEAVSADLLAEVEPASAAGLLAEVDFPGFVAGLIDGTFAAVVDASIQQMEAYADLVASVAVEAKEGSAAAGETRPTRAGASMRAGAGAATLARSRGDLARLRLRPQPLTPRPGRVDLDLPDLDAGDGASPVPENIRAIAAIYLVHGLEELRLFAVVDRLVELFIAGQLPLARGDGDALHAHATARNERLGEAERRALYDRALDPASGVADGFDARWRRFLAAVQAAAAGAPQDPVRASGLALARLASERGGGTTLPLATILAADARRCLEIVDAPAIAAALGARDRWQVIERVATLYLGGAPSLPQHRERAAAGAAVLEWLAAHLAALPSAPLALEALAAPALRWLAADASLATPPHADLAPLAGARLHVIPRSRR